LERALAQYYGDLLLVHVACALATPVLFSLRVVRTLRGRNPAEGWLRVTPHVVDSVLLLAGIALAIAIKQYPFVNGWLTAKLIALLGYIVVGNIAVRRAHRRRAKLLAWTVGLAIVLYIYAVAITKSPLPILGRFWST
jgi:uncharacterized membrane protein SirB2